MEGPLVKAAKDELLGTHARTGVNLDPTGNKYPSTARVCDSLLQSHTSTPFRTLNRHLFTRFQLIAVDFVTFALVVNRGS